ncbi:TPA: LysR family transcriptional regulator, partial [Raoultella planticola]|nr:LysR family transcriptional regulator [Raoultella planticola]
QSGIVLDNPAQGVRYDLHEMAIAAVLAGQGVAMVPRIYVEKELNQGLLVAPWPDAEQLSKTFCLVKPVETGINEPALQDFERWLQAEPMRVT